MGYFGCGRLRPVVRLQRTGGLGRPELYPTLFPSCCCEVTVGRLACFSLNYTFNLRVKVSWERMTYVRRSPAVEYLCGARPLSHVDWEGGPA